MKIAVCGSYAYDVIMNFHDSFKNHIFPDKIHMLNVAFLVPELRREFGGCAGNITYNLNLLNLNAQPVATVGSDFLEYEKWLHRCNIITDSIQVLQEEYTAQAYITTDVENNQITAFHPGAMSMAHTNNVMGLAPALAIVSPDGKEAMITHAKHLNENNIPFIFDPGQGLPMFDKTELLDFISKATWLVVNEYEAEMLQVKTGLTNTEISNQVKAMIVTKGAKGSELYADNKHSTVPPVQASKVVDPTGSGDAFRAGILYALANNLDLIQGMRLGNIIGSIKVASTGTQNHMFDINQLQQIYYTEFAESLL